MCNVSGVVFGATNLFEKEINGKRVLEVGSLDVNGSLQKVIKQYRPSEYVGVDIQMGPGVDKICDIQDLVTVFGEESFDLVVCTEVLEHVRDWRGAINNLKGVCKAGGVILVTTRSKGHRYHGYPADFWRYELSDMKKIFSDCEILKLEKDLQEPGVFMKVKRPGNLKQKNLGRIRLYSIVVNQRVKDLKPADFRSLYFLKIKLKSKLKGFITSKPGLRKFFEICASLSQP
jgi:SAM-dependent methyltransferase